MEGTSQIELIINRSPEISSVHSDSIPKRITLETFKEKSGDRTDAVQLEARIALSKSEEEGRLKSFEEKGK